MHRRHLLKALPAALLCTQAHAYAPLEYAPATWRDIRDGSDRVIVNFAASWSLTCQIKRDMLTDLVAAEPRYSALTFVEVDWDTFGRAQWTERLRVKRRSTLVALRGRDEIARLENRPNAEALRAFLDTALLG